MTLIDRLHRLQTFILETGLARSVLALPAPRMLSLPSPSSEDSEWASLYSRLVQDDALVDVTRDLFVSGFYTNAVLEAMKVLDKEVQAASERMDIAGAKLMQHVFSDDKPILVWSERKTISEKDEHRGYQWLFAGSMMGIRNPCAHEPKWMDDPRACLEALVIAQHLIAKLRKARPITKITRR